VYTIQIQWGTWNYKINRRYSQFHLLDSQVRQREDDLHFCLHFSHGVVCRATFYSSLVASTVAQSTAANATKEASLPVVNESRSRGGEKASLGKVSAGLGSNRLHRAQRCLPQVD